MLNRAPLVPLNIAVQSPNLVHQHWGDKETQKCPNNFDWDCGWVTFSTLFYLFCYGDLLFSSKEPQENSLNNFVFKKALGLLKDSFVSSGMLATILRSDVR